jgi:DNA-binding CsgD family transcriptional regulator
MISGALSQLAITTHELGDTARAKEILEEGIALCREVGYTYQLCELLESRGYVALLDGEYERGVALSEEAAALCRERGYKSGFEWALDNLGWAALLQDDHERASAYYEESLSLCKELNDKLTASESLNGLACVAGAQGEAERATRLFGAAKAQRLAQREPVTFRRQLEVDAWCEPYLRAARSRLGETSWDTALAEGKAMTFEEAFEYAMSTEAPAAHSSLVLDRSSSEARPPDLTHREEEIAVLVTRGLTNRQIASELVISEHTVATHIAKIMRKLGLSSRSQLAVWVAEQHGPPSLDSD